jgi:hypothetical protein
MCRSSPIFVDIKLVSTVAILVKTARQDFSCAPLAFCAIL